MGKEISPDKKKLIYNISLKHIKCQYALNAKEKLKMSALNAANAGAAASAIILKKNNQF